MAFTSIKFTNGKGDVVARGSHTKYVFSFYSTAVGLPATTELHGKRSADGRTWLTVPKRYIALAWKDPQNIVEELSKQDAS